LVRQALIALRYIYREGYKYQKTGIILSKLNDINIYKKDLFSSINNEEKRKKLMKAIDYTNIKYGRQALSIAKAGFKKKWNIKKQHSSKIDTACFDLLPVIRIS
jgi:DNA polymerase V